VAEALLVEEPVSLQDVRTEAADTVVVVEEAGDM